MSSAACEFAIRDNHSKVADVFYNGSGPVEVSLDPDYGFGKGNNISLASLDMALRKNLSLSKKAPVLYTSPDGRQFYLPASP
jgi:hypothetical protein